mgnify:CR=1 FL=1
MNIEIFESKLDEKKLVLDDLQSLLDEYIVTRCHMKLDVILEMIDQKTLTCDALNQFIKESNTKSIRARVHRKTRVDPTDSHIDNISGHQPLTAGSFSVAERTHPKRIDPHQQEHGEAEAAHDRSTKTQQKNAAKDEPAVEML